jgi:protein TonB
VTASVQEAKIVVMVKPEYPRAAKSARIQGVVKLHAIIDCDGKIVELAVEEGHALLVAAAVTAVQQWRYQPTLLNGEPIEVATDIQVVFRLT